MAAWRKAALAAARADAIYGVDAALTHRMGPRIAAAATALCDTVEQGRAAVQRR
jgi:ABC-type hemin transport system substrate-binding protein